MTDDTTTWLKKNPVVNPMRRSLKTSLRFHINNLEMNGSIISNQDKPKDQDLFIPRMLQRSSMRMKRFKTMEPKVTEKEEDKPKESIKKIETNSRLPRKSFVPVAREKVQHKSEIRPTFISKGSARKTVAKHQLFQKISEATKEAGSIEGNPVKARPDPTIENSILRSILKRKRVSIHNSLSDSKKSRIAKKVLFEGFEDSLENQENEINMSLIKNKSDFDFGSLDEPTIYFNFPKSGALESSPVQKSEENQTLDWTITEILPDTNSLTSVINSWKNYSENLNKLQSILKSLEDSYECYLQQKLTFQDKLTSYMKTSGEIYSVLLKSGKEIEENLQRMMKNKEKKSTEIRRNSLETKWRGTADKIKLSEKSKAIRRFSRKTNSLLRLGSWREAEGNLCLAGKKLY